MVVAQAPSGVHSFFRRAFLGLNCLDHETIPRSIHFPGLLTDKKTCSSNQLQTPDPRFSSRAANCTARGRTSLGPARQPSLAELELKLRLRPVTHPQVARAPARHVDILWPTFVGAACCAAAAGERGSVLAWGFPRTWPSYSTARRAASTQGANRVKASSPRIENLAADYGNCFDLYRLSSSSSLVYLSASTSLTTTATHMPEPQLRVLGRGSAFRLLLRLPS